MRGKDNPRPSRLTAPCHNRLEIESIPKSIGRLPLTLADLSSSNNKVIVAYISRHHIQIPKPLPSSVSQYCSFQANLASLIKP
jgi:hypothetical protein